ncbi:MAG: cytochrome-c peroxidase [Deltaproteobacteria bacterium]|nr:MAG: cytochrome-c peroxidase [Deltaproteobacteria bacterium]
MTSKILTAFLLGLLMLFGILALSGIGLAADSPEKVALGKTLFFDDDLSQPDGQSCATCHSPVFGFADPNHILPVAQGVIRRFFGPRNTPSSAYAGFSPPLHWDPTPSIGNMMQGMYVGGLFWDGRTDTLEDQAQQPFLNPLEMHNPNKAAVVRAIRNSDYASFFKFVFGPNSLKDVETAFQYAAEAIAAYERSAEMNPFSSKFDLYLDGQVQLTAAEANGLALFTGKAKCVNCHSMDSVPGVKPLFTNFGHQNIGVPANPENLYYQMPAKFNAAGKNYVDLGLGEVLAERGDPNAGVPNANAQKQNGKFKIPSLRNVARTAPYEHNGVFKTLREVVMFNNTRDVPAANWPPPEVPENVHRHMPMEPGFFGMLGLTDQEVSDIVAFLKTLTDGYLPGPRNQGQNF